MKDRIKTYSFWVGLSGAVVVLIQAIGRLAGFVPKADIISNIVMAIAGVLVVFGVVSSPTEEEINEQKNEKTNKQDRDKENKDK